VDPQYPVPVLFTQVLNAAAGGLEDAQAQEPEHGDQREVVVVGQFPGRGEQRLELQVGEPERR
jgi:hypothetical protein